jgi:hypothetical protein
VMTLRKKRQRVSIRFRPDRAEWRRLAQRDPLEVRKATLASVLAKPGPGIRFNEHIEGDGPTVFAHACKLGLEGIVSKRKDSAYRSGRSAREGKPTPSSPTIGRGSRRYTSW